jgi:hypothetical protein
LEGCSRAVNVVSSPNRVIPHPLIERSGNHPTGAHHYCHVKIMLSTILFLRNVYTKNRTSYNNFSKEGGFLSEA